MGCSTHSVPSWSNSAIRSSFGTNFGLDLSVVAWTKSRIAFFQAPSFHEGSGSSAAADTPPKAPNAVVAADALIKSLLVIFMKTLLAANRRPNWSATYTGVKEGVIVKNDRPARDSGKQRLHYQRKNSQRLINAVVSMDRGKR